jgi:hypothetical protein
VELALGLAGILAALIGTLIGAGIGIYIERGRQEFERAERARLEGLEMMRAAHVLDSELAKAENTLDFYPVQRNRVWPPELAYPDGAVWPQLRAVVATALDPVGWITLNTGFLAVDNGRVFAEEYVNLGYDHTKDLSAGTKAIFESPLKHIREARAALHPLPYPDHVRIPEGLRPLLDAVRAQRP